MDSPQHQIRAVPELDIFSQLLRCDTCKEVLLPPVYSCSVGHNMCGVCHGKVTNTECPHCPNNNTTQFRNHFANSLLEECMIMCKNRGSGCNFQGNGSSLVPHENNCIYRPICCPCCLNDVKVTNFYRHLESSSKVTLYKQQLYCIGNAGMASTQFIYPLSIIQGRLQFKLVGFPNRPFGGRVCTWLKLDNKDFFLCIGVKRDGLSIFAYISMFAEQHVLSKWQARIEMFDTDEGVVFSYLGPVRSVYQSDLEIESSKYCLTINEDLLLRMIASGTLTVGVNLIQKNESLLKRFAMASGRPSSQRLWDA